MLLRPIALACAVLLTLPRASAAAQARRPGPADAQALLTLLQISLTDSIVNARKFWRAELQEGMSLADFEAKFPRGSDGYGHFINLLAFWETVGSLMQRGLLNEDLAFDTFLDAPPWKKVERIIKEKRARDKQPLEAVNFEWVAGRAAAWVARHDAEMQRRK